MKTKEAKEFLDYRQDSELQKFEIQLDEATQKLGELRAEGEKIQAELSDAKKKHEESELHLLIGRATNDEVLTCVDLVSAYDKESKQNKAQQILAREKVEELSKLRNNAESRALKNARISQINKEIDLAKQHLQSLEDLWNSIDQLNVLVADLPNGQDSIRRHAWLWTYIPPELGTVSSLGFKMAMRQKINEQMESIKKEKERLEEQPQNLNNPVIVPTRGSDHLNLLQVEGREASAS